ncbi:hypothetical protein F030043B2_14910 [Bacteroides fragilis]|jgi:hypothetical protein|uniref:Uncharacterized protein n=1 Tax=Bacteroides fragilis str. S36L11 TaxID=1339327 RepID=A0A015YFU6_BACFG|nr:hypothetical protein [Bacteroides fragilis]EXZ30797.1 hypothetical protein M136_5437 [Bacteroides fragilis str. S36L11]KAB5480363.1 hypothetical protein F9003_01330 [Bacteroides fragilis]MCE9395793.1 hypothetical protein [Bacteroides fragilis]TWV54199.1 hypothetical protein FSA01_01320 [Bacteroides fragilis]UVO59167.1 hypothetical protein NXW10_13300 [Bacteroides fragilis]
MVQLILENRLIGNSGWIVEYFDVQGSKYINTVKIRGDKDYQIGDIFNAIEYGHDGLSSYQRKHGIEYDGISFQSSIEKAEVEILLNFHLIDELKKRFKPCFVYQEEWMNEDDYDEAVRDKAKEIYVDIITNLSEELHKDFEEIDESVSVNEYDDIICSFSSQIINYTA